MRGHLRSTHAEFFLNYTIIKCIVILSVCQMIGSNISDITYSVKQNGVMLSLDYTEPIDDFSKFSNFCSFLINVRNSTVNSLP